MTNQVTLQQLSQIIDDSLQLLKQAAINEQPKLPTQEPVASLLQQCLELCEQHQTYTQEPIRIIYHFGLPANSTFIASLATLANTSVLIDVFPTNNIKPSFKERAVVSKSIDLDNATQSNTSNEPSWKQPFLNELQQLQQESNQIGQRLLLCNNFLLPHLMQGGDYADLLAVIAEKFNQRALILVADPVDSYQSYRLLAAPESPLMSFESYTQRISEFITRHSELATVRYEDFDVQPDKVIQEICKVLDLPFNINSSFVQGAFSSNLTSESIGKKYKSLIQLIKTGCNVDSPFFQRPSSTRLQQQMQQLVQDRDQILAQIVQNQDNSHISSEIFLQLQDELLKLDAQIELIEELLLRKSVSQKLK